MRVLIVEDSTDIAKLVGLILEDAGATVQVRTTDFLGLLTAAEWDWPDALVCDLMLPGISGLDIIRVARHCRPNLRIVVLSAVLEHPPAYDELKLLADALLLKPSPVETIVQEVMGGYA